MVTSTFTLTQGKLKLHAKCWKSSIPTNKTIGIIHGLGEHSGRYDHAAAFFTAAGYDVYAFDHQGHGQSDGAKGTIESYASLVSGIDTFLNAITGSSDQPTSLFLWGHSMGGLILLSYLEQSKYSVDLAGAVVTSPPLKLSNEPNALLKALAGTAKSLVPNLTKSNELELNALSRDRRVVEAYVADPLVHDRVSMRLGADMLSEPTKLFNSDFKNNVPLLLMHGSADGITHPDGTRMFAEQLGDKCQLKIWDGFYHELHNEPEQQEVFSFMLDWLEKTRL